MTRKTSSKVETRSALGTNPDLSALRRLAVAGVKWNGVATFTGGVVQLLTLALLARLLPPQDFGLMSMAVVVTGFGVLVMDAGFGNAIIHRQDATRHELSSLYWGGVLIGVALFIAVFGAAPLVAQYYGEPAVTPVLRWSAGVFLIVPWGQQFDSLLRRDLRFRTVSKIRIAEHLTYAVSSVALAMAGLGVMSLVFAALARSAVSAAALVAVGASSGRLPLPRFALSDFDRFRSFSLFQIGDRALNYLGNNVDYLIVGRFLGPELLGYYMLAYTVVRTPLQYINPVVTSVAFPAFARVQRDDHVLRLGYQRIVRYISTVTLPMMAGMLVIAPVFIQVVFGESWLAAAPVLQVFCILGALKAVGNPTGSLLLAKGRADVGFYLNLFTLVGLAASNYIGARWGIVGVAASSAIFIAVMFPVGVALRRWLIGLTLREYLRALSSAGRASLVLIGATVLVGWQLPDDIGAVLTFGLLVLVGVSTYAAALWFVDRSFFTEMRLYFVPSARQGGAS